jgi:hypothetical protein
MGMLREIVNKEVSAIEDNPACAGKNVKNVLICIQYEDDHIHVQMPPLPVAGSMLQHIAEQITARRIIVTPERKVILP